MGLNARAIGLKIQQARIAKGMTQGDLAKALGIDRGSVGRWETGKAVPKQVGLPNVAKILGTAPELLLEGAADMNMASETVEVLRSERRTLKELREEVRKLSRQETKKHYVATPQAKKDLKVKTDRKTLEDIMLAWELAKPEARLIAALLITGDWSYKLKLINREISIGDDLLNLLGRITA